MEEAKKIHLIFKYQKKSSVTVKVKINQKLIKAMRFCCEILKKSMEDVCFHHKDKELFGDDSAKSVNLIESDTIIVSDKNPHSKYKNLMKMHG